jgi:hypothetical protein
MEELRAGFAMAGAVARFFLRRRWRACIHFGLGRTQPATSSVGARVLRAAALIWWCGDSGSAASGVRGCGLAFAAVWAARSRRVLALDRGTLGDRRRQF